MEKVLKNSWALFLGMGALMLAYGFQGSLLGVRAVKEEFSLTATGFMCLDILLVTLLVPKLFLKLFLVLGILEFLQPLLQLHH